MDLLGKKSKVEFFMLTYFNGVCACVYVCVWAYVKVALAVFSEKPEHIATSSNFNILSDRIFEILTTGKLIEKCTVVAITQI